MAPTVLITGASQGIGKATAWLFAQQGYDLILAARQIDRLEALANELRSQQHQVLAIPTDVRDAEQVQSLMRTAIAQMGQIDVLVNNAGIYISGAVEEFSLEDWHQAIDTNLWGYIHTIYAVLPHFLSQGKGTIVNVSSIGGKVPLPYLAPYTTSKFAITGLTEALNSELSAKGIHVGGVYPNIIKSNFLERAIFRGKTQSDTQARRQQVEQVLQVPLIETPEDVAKAIWQVVQHKHKQVIVGSANLSIASHRLFPNVMQWIIRKTFQNQDTEAHAS
ncbi:SDR family NAD(P)-dependent oxidoreductase [Pantanalinema sp. GBBB05]|uniref:SDR family NAD(P)-dependent oxidoreductase n=1 Tax=Pantanalinema sp. GBBB05 TaxID=2604139 RepID=UPI001E00D6F2|nr:SDR family oxidoreductase [Pantanalinema sp. GBBB05]